MTKVKGCGPILKAVFDGKSKMMFPSLKANVHFAGTKDLVLLSIIGNQYCQGEYLGAIVENALATHEFTTFLVADEIYWHNLKPSGELSSALVCQLKEQAIKLGSEYIENQLAHFLKPMKIDPEQFNKEHKNKTIAEKIIIINELAKAFNYEIVCWKNWVERAPEAFKGCAHESLELYSENPVLRKSVDEQSKNFARRHVENNDQFELVYTRSQGYLQEESLYIIWLSAFYNYNFIVYPGEMPKPFAATKDYFVKNRLVDSPLGKMFIQVDKPEVLVNWLEVNFIRKPEPKIIAKHATTPSGTEQPSRDEGVIAINKSNTFFGKPANKDTYIVEVEPIPTGWATLMASITKTVLESEHETYEFKLQYIEQLVNRLSAEISPLDLGTSKHSPLLQ